MIVNCKIGHCDSTLDVEGPLSPKFRYICKNHKLHVQLKAAGGVYNAEEIEKKTDAHFQDCQFDTALKYSGKPAGTVHISRQASEVAFKEESR